jgi:hypothetical protein
MATSPAVCKHHPGITAPVAPGIRPLGSERAQIAPDQYRALADEYFGSPRMRSLNKSAFAFCAWRYFGSSLQRPMSILCPRCRRHLVFDRPGGCATKTTCRAQLRLPGRSRSGILCSGRLLKRCPRGARSRFLLISSGFCFQPAHTSSVVPRPTPEVNFLRKRMDVPFSLKEKWPLLPSL